MALRLLVFGASGQVGSALSAAQSPGLEVIPVKRSDANLLHPETCIEIIKKTSAHAVINAAAFTNVDQAEKLQDTAMQVNASAPGLMAEVAAAKGVPFLHVSTDYVFCGSGTKPWGENDLANPVNAYGVSKYQGEFAVLRAGGPAAVLRTSWVHSTSSRNFLTTMRQAAEQGRPVRVVDDQWGGPTSARAIANALVIMARAFIAGHGETGIYHFQGAPVVTWYGFAKAIFARTNLSVTPPIIPIPSKDWPTPAQRPLNGRLDCSLIARKFGIRQPDWREDLTEMMMITEALA